MHAWILHVSSVRLTKVSFCLSPLSQHIMKIFPENIVIHMKFNLKPNGRLPLAYFLPFHS